MAYAAANEMAVNGDAAVAVPAVLGLDDIEGVMRLYRARILRYAMFAVRDRDAAETITQECFLKAYRARESFRGDCSLSTWLMQIAVNLVRDYARSKQFQFWKRAQTSAVDVSEVTEFLRHPGSSAEAGVLAREQLKSVWTAVEKLSKMQREVFLLAVCRRDGATGDCGADGDEGKHGEIASLSGLEFSADASACGNGWSAMNENQNQSGQTGRGHLTAKEISRWLVEGPEQSASRHCRAAGPARRSWLRPRRR